jgi:drug/metabolite transporter (DMT)-like permease
LSYLIAIASAALYGTADFLGGLVSRRIGVVSVVLQSQLAGIIPLALVLWIMPHASPPRTALLWGAFAGLIGGAGIGLLYRALAIGTMSVVAPMSAVASIGIPVLVSVLAGERPAPLALAGIVLAVIAIVLVTQKTEPQEAIPGHERLRGVGTALASGVAIGFFFLSLAKAGPAGGLWPLFVARCVTVAVFGIAALARGRAVSVRASLSGTALLGGILDVFATALYVLAVQRGPFSIVVTLASLYPAGTVLMARIVFRERLNAWQISGIGCGLTAIMLMATAPR